ncbi:MAG TPA: hypothetical protein EYP90_14895, partial [Chromatiaceae bacterium]|nr:hypothetical protein [Chromatiaceae bacterium]
MATTAETFDTPVGQEYGSHSLLRLTLRRLFKQRNALIGMTILLFLILVAIFAPVLAPHDPIKDFVGVPGAEKRGDPCIYLLGCSRGKPQHFMGLDGNFRDQFSRLIFGTRVSLFIG